MPQRKTGHVTLMDVAKAAGLSVSTVSIVLSNAPLSKNVAESTRDRVREMARQLGYHPDARARSLRRQSTQTIGVLAFDLSDPFCVPIMRGIQNGLQAANYLPLVMDAQTQRKLFDSSLNLLLERRVEGVIVIASWVFEETNLLADVKKNNVPVLIVGRDMTARGINSILVDNEAGGAWSLKHLHALGHKRIAFIRGPREMSDSKPRWEGICRVAAEAGVKIDEKLVFELPGIADAESGFEEGMRLSQLLLQSGKRFSAVLAFDDLTALGVVRGLTQAGVRVPEDCSVMGFDDVLPAMVATPAMTTIRQPLNEMGHQAAEKMLESVKKMASGKIERARLMKTAPELVARASTAKA